TSPVENDTQFKLASAKWELPCSGRGDRANAPTSLHLGSHFDPIPEAQGLSLISINVDLRDPVQLNLLHVQARDDILNGSHPVSFKKACEFGGSQAQIQFGPH
ncbi:hypothetical protein P7K49_032123, partial [Saguinus oedipus]